MFFKLFMGQLSAMEGRYLKLPVAPLEDEKQMLQLQQRQANVSLTCHHIFLQGKMIHELASTLLILLFDMQHFQF